MVVLPLLPDDPADFFRTTPEGCSANLAPIVILDLRLAMMLRNKYTWSSFYPMGRLMFIGFFLREMTGILTYNLDLLHKMTQKYSPLNGNALMVIYVIFIPWHPNP